MPRPFPGIDPFVELQAWTDFHSTFNVSLRADLQAAVGERYVVRIEREVVLATPEPDLASDVVRIPDVDVVADKPGPATPASVAEISTTAIAAPREFERITLDFPTRLRSYLAVRTRDDQQVVTVVETLSPTNKRAGSGRRTYLAKREEYLASSVHLIEVDFLLQGLPLPPLDEMAEQNDPAGRLTTLVSDWRTRPRFELYRWSLFSELPIIDVPLAGDAEFITLDLQRSLDRVYELGFGNQLQRDHSRLAGLPAAVEQAIRQRLGE